MIERAGDRITYRGGLNEGSQVLNLTPAAATSNEYQALRTKLDETARAYPTFEDNFGYRVKATQLLIVLLLAQELLLLFSRFKLRTYYPRFRALTTASWSTVGVALILFFDHWIATLSGIGSPL